MPGTIRRFEDVKAWQKARDLTKKAYLITSKGQFARDFGLRDQVRRASVSLMLNIAEGFARKTDGEFAQFLVHTHGSAAEFQSALYVALDQGYISAEDFQALYDSAEEVSKMVIALSQYLKNLR